MKRRNLLAATGTLGGAAAIGSAIGSSSMAQAKPVFLDYTQEQLDEAYDQSFWAPQILELEAVDSSNSAEVRREMPPRTERYGSGATDLIDIFTPAGKSGFPIVVFIHGGAWTRNSRLDASFPARWSVVALPMQRPISAACRRCACPA